MDKFSVDQIGKIQAWVKKILWGESSGHDYFHVFRVVKLADRIAREHPVDPDMVTAIAWLHDVDDPKISGHGSSKVFEFLQTIGVGLWTNAWLRSEIDHISYSSKKIPKSLEGRIVQDADRIDAIGAVGIARCFAFGGSHDRLIYNPADMVEVRRDQIGATGDSQSGIKHFYDKLLLVKDQMNTEQGRKIAESRHDFLQTYLNEFFLEWNGEK